jgi:NADH-quinone oxidoreductase subunit J
MATLFYIIAAISVISALFVVSAKNPVNSVIALIVCFLSIAGHYILLNAQFLAMVHIIVYTGAIMVLFLFVIMLLNLNRASEPMKTLGTRVAAVLSAGCCSSDLGGRHPQRGRHLTGERLRPRHRAGAQRGHVPLQ